MAEQKLINLTEERIEALISNFSTDVYESNKLFDEKNKSLLVIPEKRNALILS